MLYGKGVAIELVALFQYSLLAPRGRIGYHLVKSFYSLYLPKCGSRKCCVEKEWLLSMFLYFNILYLHQEVGEAIIWLSPFIVYAFPSV